MKRSLFEIAVLHHKLDENTKEVNTEIVIDPVTILATCLDNARMSARLKAMDEDGLCSDDVDSFEQNYQILVRPFG